MSNTVATGTSARDRRNAFDEWTEAAPSAEAVAVAIVELERRVTFLRSFQKWREVYWRNRHSELRAQARAERRSILKQERLAEELSEFAQQLAQPAQRLLAADTGGRQARAVAGADRAARPNGPKGRLAPNA